VYVTQHSENGLSSSYSSFTAFVGFFSQACKIFLVYKRRKEYNKIIINHYEFVQKHVPVLLQELYLQIGVEKKVSYIIPVVQLQALDQVLITFVQMLKLS